MDSATAQTIMGKTVLICLTLDPEPSTEPERKQLFGTIMSFSEKDGIVVQLQNSTETFALPPFIQDLKKAAPGQYHLKATGEVIVDPDYLAFWVVQRFD